LRRKIAAPDPGLFALRKLLSGPSLKRYSASWRKQLGPSVLCKTYRQRSRGYQPHEVFSHANFAIPWLPFSRLGAGHGTRRSSVILRKYFFISCRLFFFDFHKRFSPWSAKILSDTLLLFLTPRPNLRQEGNLSTSESRHAKRVPQERGGPLVGRFPFLPKISRPSSFPVFVSPVPHGATMGLTTIFPFGLPETAWGLLPSHLMVRFLSLLPAREIRDSRDCEFFTLQLPGLFSNSLFYTSSCCVMSLFFWNKCDRKS